MPKLLKHCAHVWTVRHTIKRNASGGNVREYHMTCALCSKTMTQTYANYHKNARNNPRNDNNQPVNS